MILRLTIRAVVAVALAASLAGCGSSYSPNTYASTAVQQANKVEQGVIVGVRPVDVSASGATGAVAGAAAGGITGSQVGTGVVSAFSALGGSLVGGIAGSAAEHGVGDTTAIEYIVRKPNGDLISVTQQDATPLALGQKVLVIDGKQARVVPDYTVTVAPPAKPPEAAKPLDTTQATAPPSGPVAAVPLAPPPASDAPSGAPSVESGP